jgi:ribonuclease HII
MDKTTKYIVGIDEVGRGPIAGPVAVCAFMIKNDSLLENQKEKKLPKLKDSKKLSKKQREIWFEYLRGAKTEGFCDYAVSFVSSLNIDKFGIVKCIQKALNKSLNEVATRDFQNFPRFTQSDLRHTQTKNLESPVSLNSFASYYIYLDGGLHAPIEYTKQETIIRGDELHPIISMASIMAKVSRDRIMMNYAKEYPEYGFDSHVGYGTKAHYAAIKKHGQTPIHRKSFIH